MPELREAGARLAKHPVRHVGENHAPSARNLRPAAPQQPGAAADFEHARVFRKLNPIEHPAHLPVAIGAEALMQPDARRQIRAVLILFAQEPRGVDAGVGRHRDYVAARAPRGSTAARLSAAYRGCSSVDCRTPRPGSEKDITEVSGTSSPGSIPGRGIQSIARYCEAASASAIVFKGRISFRGSSRSRTAPKRSYHSAARSLSRQLRALRLQPRRRPRARVSGGEQEFSTQSATLTCSADG